MALPELLSSPKLRRFARALNISTPHAVGLLEVLWLRAADRRGDPYLGDATDVALGCDWEGDAEELTEALLGAGGGHRAGFIERDPDGSYRLHGFYEHQPRYVRRRRLRALATALNTDPGDLERAAREGRFCPNSATWVDNNHSAPDGRHVAATQQPAGGQTTPNGDERRHNHPTPTPPPPSPSTPHHHHHARDGGGLAEGEATTYFRAIERAFCDWADRSMLTPDDYQHARGWQEAGMPLPWVLGQLRALFDAAQDDNRPGSLKYCNRPLRREWDKQRRRRAPGERAEPDPFEALPRLERLVAALPEQHRDPWASLIVAADGEDPEAVEGRLQELSDRLETVVYESLPPGELRQLEHDVDAALGPLQSRLSTAEAGRTRIHLRRKLLRERYGIPRLSLFSTEAEGGDA